MAAARSTASRPPRLGVVLGPRTAPAGYPAGMGASWSCKLCARCGQTRTSNVSNGEPVCTPCLALRRAEDARKDQPVRKCPADGAAMALVVVHGVVIDRCGTCGGVFLDPGELDALRASAARGAAVGEGWDGFLQGAIGALF